MVSLKVAYTVFLALLFHALNITASPIVTLPLNNITYIGTSTNNVDTFLEIPYGQDTSGDNRFAPPKPFILAPNTIFNATLSGPACPQQVGVATPATIITDISEDCLKLRISRPSFANVTSGFPVMVWIYGGGFSGGQIYDALYNPEQLILDSVVNDTPVIYVAMNYRLGIFGFPDSDLLRDTKSLNVGLRDQILALEWIRENIENFGGDPDKVTIFGQSAGAISAVLQVTAFGGKPPPPFQQAIAESFPVGTGFLSHNSFNGFQSVVNSIGCSNPDEELALSCLRNLPFDTLLNISLTVADTISPFSASPGALSFSPVVDGDFIPSLPSELLQTRQFPPTKLIIGFNNDDASVFTPTSIETEMDIANTLLKITPGLTNSTLSKLLSLYPVSEFAGFPASNISAQWTRASRIMRDSQFTCPSLFLASNIAFSHSVHTTEQVFIYTLNQSAEAPLLAAAGLSYLGVSHGAEILYVFDEVNLAGGAPRRIACGTGDRELE